MGSWDRTLTVGCFCFQSFAAFGVLYLRKTPGIIVVICGVVSVLIFFLRYSARAVVVIRVFDDIVGHSNVRPAVAAEDLYTALFNLISRPNCDYVSGSIPRASMINLCGFVNSVSI